MCHDWPPPDAVVSAPRRGGAELHALLWGASDTALRHLVTYQIAFEHCGFIVNKEYLVDHETNASEACSMHRCFQHSSRLSRPIRLRNAWSIFESIYPRSGCCCASIAFAT